MVKKRTIAVKTQYGIFTDIPNTTWRELESYWPDIVACIIEVVLENGFNINEVRKNNPSGFVASKYYWDAHKKHPKRYPLIEAKKFISKLKNKKRFNEAIIKFNKRHNTNWLLEENIPILGSFLRSFCIPIYPYLKNLKIGISRLS